MTHPATRNAATTETTMQQPPKYPRRAAPLDDSIKAAYGVETGHELVAILNETWAKSGRRPLPQGSYPTTRVLLTALLRHLREAGVQTRVDTANAA